MKIQNSVVIGNLIGVSVNLVSQEKFAKWLVVGIGWSNAETSQRTCDDYDDNTDNCDDNDAYDYDDDIEMGMLLCMP